MPGSWGRPRWHRVYTYLRAQPVAIRIEICDRLVAGAFPRLAARPAAIA
jgi:hypothetical protein